ncbi:MAG: lipoyl(octanoyl) transferase LipB [Acidobacteria bacterium]|nr:lipoyl(octanoyl) transferase LipB [Acidobacteriota bacterium]
MDVVEVRRLGMVPYADALTLQAELVEERKAGRIPDQLLLLEHPPVITLGAKVRQDRSHLLATPAFLESAGISLFEAGRGGDVTYHGPGQLVGYPILDLRPDRCDVHRYVRDLEAVMIGAALHFGVEADRAPGLSGAWVGTSKLAAIGVRISRWITSHGFAFNVTTDLSHFGLIVPCGIADRGVTSLEALLARPVPLEDVEDAVVRVFGEVFDRQPVEVPSSPAVAPQR